VCPCAAVEGGGGGTRGRGEKEAVVVGREGEDAVVGRSGGGGTQGEEFEAAQALTEAVGDEREGWVAVRSSKLTTSAMEVRTVVSSR